MSSTKIVGSNGTSDKQITSTTDGAKELLDVGAKLIAGSQVIVLERMDVKWTTAAHFDKGTQNKTQTIDEEDGAVSLNFSPFAAWHFNEAVWNGTTDEVVDSSGNNNHGTASGATTIADGKLNRGGDFDGVNDQVDFGDILGFERTDPFSLEVWLKTTSTDAGSIMTKIGSLNDDRGYKFFLRTSGKVQVILQSGAGNLAKIKTTTKEVNDGAWHHVVFTYDGSSTTAGMKIYVDGVSEVLIIDSDTLTATILNSRVFKIGVLGTSSIDFDGQIDEAVVYDFELTTAQVSARYNSGTGTEIIHEASGTYTSNAYDSQYQDLEWDKVFFNQDLPAGTTAVYKVRTGEDGVSWSAYSSALANGDDILTTGKFIQWKVDYTTTDDLVTPKTFDLSLIFFAPKRILVEP